MFLFQAIGSKPKPMVTADNEERAAAVVANKTTEAVSNVALREFAQNIALLARDIQTQNKTMKAIGVAMLETNADKKALLLGCAAIDVIVNDMEKQIAMAGISTAPKMTMRKAIKVSKGFFKTIPKKTQPEEKEKTE